MVRLGTAGEERLQLSLNDHPARCWLYQGWLYWCPIPADIIMEGPYGKGKGYRRRQEAKERLGSPGGMLTPSEESSVASDLAISS